MTLAWYPAIGVPRGSACPTPDRQEGTADALASVPEIPGKAWINLESWRDGS
jgi:hypothetical protein